MKASESYMNTMALLYELIKQLPDVPDDQLRSFTWMYLSKISNTLMQNYPSSAAHVTVHNYTRAKIEVRGDVDNVEVLVVDPKSWVAEDLVKHFHAKQLGEN